MLGYYIFLSAVTLMVATIAVLDWLTRRKDRQTRDRAGS
jgi:hypothetical protein